MQNRVNGKTKCWHIPRIDDLHEHRPDGVFRLLRGQLNSATSTRACNRGIADLGRIINKWDVQGGGLSKEGINWRWFSCIQQLSSWFKALHNDVLTSTAYNVHKNIGIGQPGGIGLFGATNSANISACLAATVGNLVDWTPGPYIWTPAIAQGWLWLIRLELTNSAAYRQLINSISNTF